MPLFKETLPSAATSCASQNMSVLSIETVEELFCLLTMIPAGEKLSLVIENQQ